MAGIQQLLLMDRRSLELASGTITVSGASDYGYKTPSIGSVVAFSGPTPSYLYSTFDAETQSNVLVFSSALPSSPESVVVTIDGVSLTMPAVLAGGSYEETSTVDAWGLSSKVGQTLTYFVRLP